MIHREGGQVKRPLSPCVWHARERNNSAKDQSQKKKQLFVSVCCRPPPLPFRVVSFGASAMTFIKQRASFNFAWLGVRSFLCALAIPISVFSYVTA